MVRWRCALVLAMLLLLPAITDSGPAEEEGDEERGEEGEEDDDDDEEEEEEETSGNKEDRATVARAPAVLMTSKTLPATRTPKRRPLECYVCAYKSETPLRSCLDPTKYRVHSITCHSADDKCFTSVISKGSTYEAVVRGCRSGCVGSPETTCCEVNRCNNQAFAMPPPPVLPVVAPIGANPPKSKAVPDNCRIPVLFFVKVLLVLQLVVKVSFI